MHTTIHRLKRGSFLCGAVLFLLLSFGISQRTYAASVSIAGLSPGGAVQPGTEVYFEATATGFVSPQYSVSDSFSASGSTVGSIGEYGNFTWTPTIYDAGTHTITVSVTDSAGDSASASVNIQVVSNSILIQNLSPGSPIAAGRTETFQVLAPGFINPTYSVRDAYAGSSITNNNIDPNAGVFTWVPQYNEQGLHDITVTAMDDYGHSASVIEPITVIAPVLSIKPALDELVTPAGQTASFTASAPLLSSPSFSLADTFSGTSTMSSSDITSSGTFSWVASTTDEGTHDVVVTATDALGNSASTTEVILVTQPLPGSTTQTTSEATTTTSSSSSSSSSSMSSSSSTSSPSGYVFSTYLGIGSRGVSVTELQNLLTALGVYTGPVTGYYGVLTSAGVRRFQTLHGISAVGYVGPLTRAALTKASSAAP